MRKDLVGLDPIEMDGEDSQYYANRWEQVVSSPDNMLWKYIADNVVFVDGEQAREAIVDLFHVRRQFQNRSYADKLKMVAINYVVRCYESDVDGELKFTLLREQLKERLLKES